MLEEVPNLNLNLCKLLKRLGYPQDGGGWYWTTKYVCGDSTPHDCMLGECRKPPEMIYKLELLKERYNTENVKAPTCRELGEWLPYFIKHKMPKIEFFRKFLNLKKREIK